MSNGTNLNNENEKLKDTTPTEGDPLGLTSVIEAADNLLTDVDKEPLVWATSDNQIITPEKLEELFPDEKDREDAIKRMGLNQVEETSGRTDYLHSEGVANWFRKWENKSDEDWEKGGVSGTFNQALGWLSGQAADIMEDDSSVSDKNILKQVNDSKNRELQREEINKDPRQWDEVSDFTKVDPNTGKFNTLDNISPAIFRMEQEEGIKDLESKYEGTGFTFAKSGEGMTGDAITITSPNGEETIEIPMDRYAFSGGDEASRDMFMDFINTHQGDLTLDQINQTHNNKITGQGDLESLLKNNTLSNSEKAVNHADAEADIKLSDFWGDMNSWAAGELKAITDQNNEDPGWIANALENTIGTANTISIIGGLGAYASSDSVEYTKNAAKEIEANGDVVWDETLNDGEGGERPATFVDIQNLAIKNRAEYLNDQTKQGKINDQLNWWFDDEHGKRVEAMRDEMESDSEEHKDVLEANERSLMKISALGEDLGKDGENLQVLIDDYNKAKADGTVDEATVNKLNEAINGFNNKRELYGKVRDGYKGHFEAIEVLDEGVDNAEAFNNQFANLGVTIGIAGEDLAGNLAWLSGQMLDYTLDAGENVVVKKLVEGGMDEDEAREYVEKMNVLRIQSEGMIGLGRSLKNMANEHRDYTQKQPEGYQGILNSIEKGLLGVGEQLPNMALAVATGGGSIGANMAVYGVSGIADKHFEMTGDMESGFAKYSPGQLIMAPVIHGAAESLTMVPEMLMARAPIGKMLNKIRGKKPSAGFGGADGVIPRNKFYSNMGKTILGLGVGQAGEVGQETITQLGQNYVDIHMLGDKDKLLTDGLNADFLIKTMGATGTFYAGPRVMNTAMNLAMGRGLNPLSIQEKIQKNSRNLLNIETQIGKLKTNQKNAASPEVAASIQKEIDVLETKRSSAAKKAEGDINEALNVFSTAVGPQGLDKLRSLAREGARLQNRAAEIKKDKNLTGNQKKEMLNELREQFKQVEEKKGQIINNQNKYKLEKPADITNLENQARDNLMEKDGKQPTQEQLEKEAERIFDNNNFDKNKRKAEAENSIKNRASKLETEHLVNKMNEIDPTKPIQLKEFNSLKEAESWLVNDMANKGYDSKSPRTKQAMQELRDNWDSSAANIFQPEMLDQDGSPQLNDETSTFDKHQMVIVNAKKAAVDPDFNARGHDVFHGMLWKAFKSSGQGFKNISEGLVKHITSKDKAGAEWLNGELSQLDQDSPNYHEEVIAKIADGMRNGDIKVTPDVSKRIGGLIRSAGQELGVDTKMMIKDPADMFDLIASYNKNLKSDGRLSGALKSALEQGVVVDPKLQPKRQLQPDQRITKQYKDEKAFENKIQKLYEQGKTFEITEAYKPRVQKILEAEWKNFLEANNIRKGDGQYDLVVDEVLTGNRGIYDIIKDYKPGKVPLSGYIGSIMQKRGISEQVFKIVPDTQGMYKQEIDAQTRKIADEVIEEIVEAKKDLLKETINLDPGILNEVVTAVIKTFGTDLGDIKSPQFKKKLADNFKLQLGKKIKDMLGTRAGYQDYLDNNWENIWKSIPQDIVNKSFPELNEKVLTKKGKQARAKTKAGRRIFQKKKLTQKEFIDYFMPPAINPETGKRSGLAGTRKQGLANAVAETLARDEVMDVLSNPEVATKFEEINELLGRKLDKGWKAQVQKAIDGIDQFSKELENATGFMGTPQMVSVFSKALSTGLKAGKSFIESVIDAINALRKIYKKGLTKQEQEHTDDHYNDIIDQIRKYMKEPTTESEMKERLKEIFDPKNPIWNVNEQDVNSGQQFMSEMKELAKTDPTIKTILKNQDNKSIWNKSPKKMTDAKLELQKNHAEQTDNLLKRVPQSFINGMLKIPGMSMSKVFGFAGQQYSMLWDSETQGKGKNKIRVADTTGNFYSILQGRDMSLSPKDIDAAVEAGVMSKETAKAVKEVQWDKVELMNKDYANSGTMLRKMIDIAEGDGTVAEKQKAIDAAMDTEIGANNIKAFKAIAMMMKDAYNDGVIDDSHILNNLQGQTSVAASFRSLSYFGGIQLKDGPDPGFISLGEHMNPNAGTMNDLVSWIRDKNATESQLDAITDKHEQIFGDGTKVKDKDGNDIYSESGILAKVDMKNPKTGFKLPRTSKLGIERYSKVLTKKEQQSIYFPARGNKVGVNLTERIAAKQLQEGKINKENKAADTENKTWLPKDMSLETGKLWQKALKLFQKGTFDLKKAPHKGITVVDFDQTVANTTEQVTIKYKDGSSKDIGAKEFAETVDKITSDPNFDTFDFSNFEQVEGAKPGPIMEKVKEIASEHGTSDIHILTARPQAAALAIQAFMKANGLDIKIENITGLESAKPEAKRDFIIKKLAEGYNNFFFSDDSNINVKEVKKVLKKLDVKSEVYQALQEFKRDLNKKFNEILEENTDLSQDAEVNLAKAKLKGAKAGGWFKNFWIPYSAEDFSGLLYALIGKGKKGEAQWKFFKKALIDPFAKAIRDLNAFKQTLANELGNLKRQYPSVTKALRKDSGVSAYTNAHAIRVYNWSKAGYTAKDLGLSETDFNNLIKHVEGNPDMKAFSDKLRQITKTSEGYSKPKENGDWISGNIDTDIMDIGFEKRAEYLENSGWLDNKNEIFSKENLRKLEYKYGSKYVEAMKDMLYRMENGINRPQGSNRIVNAWQNWVNNSVGAIMFFNVRSAVLQTLSATNFINWSDNNPIMAAKAFANQSQFWKDFMFIFNHPTLKQRRAGMDIDVNAAEIAARVANSKNPVSAALNWLLQKGFIPTRMADSFAIAIGGASMYRNRVNTYLKKGFTKTEAENKAFLDFQEISEATQQSARPDMISEQQASPLGRLVLAFQVTPMQYARLMKRAGQDLVNRRRLPGMTQAQSDRVYISKILYYGVAQNLIFNAMQKALFAMMFAANDEDEEEKMTDAEKKKYANLANGMADSVLRGLGVGGAVVATVKNMLIKFLQQEKKGYRADHAYTLIEGLNISPPIGSKARKVYNATQTYKFNRDAVKEMGLDINNPAFEAVADVVSGTTNVPLDRALQNVNNVIDALDKRNAAWQRIAILMGWPSWQVDVPDREVDQAKQDVKKRKAEEKKRKKEEEKRNKLKK